MTESKVLKFRVVTETYILTNIACQDTGISRDTPRVPERIKECPGPGLGKLVKILMISHGGYHTTSPGWTAT
jgi:hypothetical protein